ncbi:MAG: SprT-like domain-containing protein [Muribaculaceae bacterium]|nr:SprT-like domain-containing protein [Muribaculaceae bacterium]
MRATIGYVEKKFREFNRLMFGDRLPEIPVRMSDATTFLGMCVAKVRTLPDGRKAHSDFELRVSMRHDIPEQELEDVIIHEMIHYFIMWNELSDTSPHGEIFKAIMRGINRAHNRKITISRKMTSEEKNVIASEKRKWHVIALVSLHSGRKGVKVLPRVVPKILDYYRNVRSAPEVKGIELFLHDHPFFNRFPVSAAYRIHPVEEKEVMDSLRGAHRLEVKGDNLIQR